MSQAVKVAGVGMTKFVKPGAAGNYQMYGLQALNDALIDAGIDYADVQQAYVGYVYGDSTSGQSVVYQAGLTGIPVFNVNNNCSTGSTALFLARQAIASGAADCVVALGFEQMAPGALSENFADRPSPLGRYTALADELVDTGKAPMAIKLFGAAGIEYQKKYGMADETFAQVSVKARQHAKHNERAIFRDAVSVEQVLNSPRMLGPITRLQCCPPSCGGAAAVLVSEQFARRKGLNASVSIRAQSMTTDYQSTFNDKSAIKLVGADLTSNAADAVYRESGVGPEDIDVVELHDCFTSNEIISYEGLRLTPEGTAEKFIQDGDNTYGGRVVTNPSGGLLSKGHPLGATGLAQCAELVWQLRGQAGVRQIDGARLGLQHNLGLGGACVVTLYEAT
jgi:sterol carrier protein 2